MVSSIGFCCDSGASRHTLLSPPPHPFLHLNHGDFFQFRGVLGFREGNSASTRVSWGSGQRRQPPEAVGATDRAWLGGWEPRVSLKWGVSKDATKGPDTKWELQAPSGIASPQALLCQSPTGADIFLAYYTPSTHFLQQQTFFLSCKQLPGILLCPLPGVLYPKPLQSSPLLVPVSPLLQSPPGCPI